MSQKVFDGLYVREMLVNRFKDHPHRIERRIDNNPACLLAETLQHLHFHPDHPENWTIHQGKASEKFVQVFNEPKERWDNMVREEVYKILLDSTSEIIEDVVSTIGANPKMSFQDIVEKKDVRKTILKKLEEGVLNGCRDVYDRIKTRPEDVPEAWKLLIQKKSA